MDIISFNLKHQEPTRPPTPILHFQIQPEDPKESDEFVDVHLNIAGKF